MHSQNESRSISPLSSGNPENGSQTQRETIPTGSTRKMDRSFYILLPVISYSFLVVFSWVIICKLTHYPITANSYGIQPRIEPGVGLSEPNLHYLYVRNERWYTAARTIQAVAGILTIPLTSAVCSCAAVVYLQHTVFRSTPKLTLRQMTSLADRGWTDLGLLWQVLTKPTNWNRYGCAFLAYGILLHILGGVISPIQQIYLSTETIKTPTKSSTIENLLDIAQKFGSHGGGDQREILVTRKLLEATMANEIPSELWTAANRSCVYTGNLTQNEVKMCQEPGLTWSTLSFIPDPFLAQLPNGFNTGLVRQFAPRFNSTASYESITAAEFPTNCDEQAGALSIRYSNSTIDGGSELWSLHACMPADMRVSPWTSTMDRQDFSEVLFLNVTLGARIRYSSYPNQLKQPSSEMFRVKVRTTAGYFELPNYMNGQVPGPLLDKWSDQLCGGDCLNQFDFPTTGSSSKSRRASNMHTFHLENVRNKGPLLTTALALFGQGSFLDNFARSPEIYYDAKSPKFDYVVYRGAPNCIDLVPFGQFLTSNVHEVLFGENQINYCVNPGEPLSAAAYLDNFRLYGTALADAFTMAAYLANRAMLFEQRRGTLWVNYDLGMDSQRPAISWQGIIVVTSLIAVYLSALFATTLYAVSLPRWTQKLDAFAMMRLGASIPDKMPLSMANSADQVLALDETPGWVGDAAGDKKIGVIGLGGPSRLRGGRQYEAYDGPVKKRWLGKFIDALLGWHPVYRVEDQCEDGQRAHAGRL